MFTNYKHVPTYIQNASTHPSIPHTHTHIKNGDKRNNGIIVGILTCLDGCWPGCLLRAFSPCKWSPCASTGREWQCFSYANQLVCFCKARRCSISSCLLFSGQHPGFQGFPSAVSSFRKARVPIHCWEAEATPGFLPFCVSPRPMIGDI